MLVTIPFVLLLLDFWPLGRFGAGSKSVYRLILEKVPFFVLSIASCIITFIIEGGGAGVSGDLLPIKTRLANIPVAYVMYILKMIWPSRLAVLYPHPGESLQIWQVVVTSLLLILISVIVLCSVRNNKYLLTGWLWFMGTLVPVIGLVQVGSQSHADRYTYVPIIGLFIMIAWGLPNFLVKWRYKKIVLGITSIAIVLVFSVCSFFQTRYWRNSIILFERAIRVTKNNSQMHYNLGTFLTRHDRLDEAINQFRKAIQIKPNYPKAHFNLANALKEQSKLGEAIHHYQLLLLVEPDNAEAHNNLAIVLKLRGKIDEAIHHYHLALKVKPDYAKAYNNLGSALLTQGKVQDAIDCFKKALQIEPDYPAALRNLNISSQLQNKSD
jgi:Tfp pilus assembly protein PilF